ncbi:MAG: hypothetical protein M1823_006266, partial [Watsoniomyces obsoletus]
HRGSKVVVGYQTMDSMRSLNTSLPSNRSSPPEQLLQAFRAAALSVTTLYKTAASDQAQTRHAGYQEAMEDLLLFLDSEQLGFGDGEGWKVRQWATDRLDQSGAPSVSAAMDTDEEKPDQDRAGSSSPMVGQGEGESDERLSSNGHRHSSPMTTTSTTNPSLDPSVVNIPPGTAFTFRSSIVPPRPSELETSNSESDVHPPPSMTTTMTTTSPSRGGASVRVGVHPRMSRHRHSMNNGKSNPRSLGVGLSSLGAGAGFKRRMPFSEFFDITGVGNGREGMNKRGRFGVDP